MKLEAMDGRVVLKLYKPESTSKILTPDNVTMEDFPTMEVVHVGKGRVSQYNGEREDIPVKVGDRVVVANSKCVMVPIDGERHFICDWTAIFARVWEAGK